MAHQTLGQLMLNRVLPESHRTTELLTKSALNKKLTAMAREDPTAYAHTVTELKRLGDEVATLEGVSVGLADVMPDYVARDKIMKPAAEAIKHAKTQAEREKIILDVQDKMLELTKSHPGTMTQMALSGARGNIAQLMKTVSSPVASVDGKGNMVPWLITHSYSQGLSPAESWVAGGEARINTYKSTGSVAEPGDIAKILVNTMYPVVITQDDCGTKNGLRMPVTNTHIIGRYLAEDGDGYKRNDLVTNAVFSTLGKKAPASFLRVRSPMTCAAHEGICRKCQGIDERGNPHAIGINVGVRAAQALSEPLTQMALSSKHGNRTLKGETKKLEGLAGTRQILEIPASFFNKATLSEHTGKVTKIVPAAHGGSYVHVGDEEHYVPPSLEVTAKVGQHVEAGDTLSDGIPKPDELIKHKGMGVGRQYMVDTLHDLYRGQGIDIDRRHLELLARADLNHVKVLDPGEHPLLKNDTIPYEKYKEHVAENTTEISLDKALHRVLGKELFHYTVGTELTPSLIETLKRTGVDKIHVAVHPPIVEPVMKSIARTPLFNPDWMARLAHRYLKDSLLKGAHNGESSNRHGLHPVPAYAYGAEFGSPNDGRY